MIEIGSKHGGGVAGVEFLACAPQPSPPRNRGGSKTAVCPVSPRLRGDEGGFLARTPNPAHTANNLRRLRRNSWVAIQMTLLNT